MWKKNLIRVKRRKGRRLKDISQRNERRCGKSSLITLIHIGYEYSLLHVRTEEISTPVKIRSPLSSSGAKSDIDFGYTRLSPNGLSGRLSLTNKTQEKQDG